ncbi:molecular chaperone [Brachionus plicatilis]|uniref:Molecular chaperone n=1 Tax=Brachionus plicatilis TaxID=10195 RepID=A0A3M7QKX7_BRAPC|nr:molecular chaperone [Brachionus plicatilis]
MWNKIELIRLKNPLKAQFNLIATRFYTTDYYNVLDLKRTATKREIKQAYYRLSKKFHPDINSEVNAAEKFKAIHEAYQILGDEKKKLDYDMSLNQGYYPTRSEGEFTFRSYRPRTGPVYPSSSSYNFEEHFQAHYGQGTKRPHPSSSRAHHSRKMSQEELKNYWNKKEFSDEDYLTNLKNQFFFRSLIVILILTASFLIIKKAKDNEEEKGRKAYLLSMQQNINKK